MKNKKILGLLGVILGNTIFGFSFLFSKIALSYTIPSVVIATRFIIAFLTANLVILLLKPFKKKDGSPLLAFSLKGKSKKDVLLLALFQPTIYMIAENYGIVYTSASFSGIVIGLIPVAGIILDFLILKNKLSLKHILCAVASVLGIVLTTFGASDLSSSFKGIVCLLIAVIAGALFYVYSKKSASTYSPFERTYIMFGVGCIFYVILALIQCRSNIDTIVKVAYESKEFWISVLYLGVLSSILAFVVINYGTTYVSIPVASIFANLGGVISLIAGVLLLNESFNLPQILGIIIIIISVFTATLEKENSSI